MSESAFLEINFEQEINKAILALERAYESQFTHTKDIKELSYAIVSETEVMKEFDLKPSEFKQMEDAGLQFIEKYGQKLYKRLELEAYFDLFFTIDPEE